MEVELQCSRCFQRLSSTPSAALTRLLERLAEEGPWSSVGDGETLEDRIFTSLDLGDNVRCPGCGAAMVVSQRGLGRLTKELLACW